MPATIHAQQTRKSPFHLLYNCPRPVLPADWTIRVKIVDNKDDKTNNVVQDQKERVQEEGCKTLEVHKLILACASQFFAALFQNEGNFSDSASGVTELQLTEFESHVLENIIVKFMYFGDHIEMRDDAEIACTLVLSQYLQIEELEQVCHTLLCNVDRHQVFAYYMTLLLHHPTLCLDQQQMSSTVSYLAEQFQSIGDKIDLYALPSDILCDILSSDELCVSSEDDVLDFVQGYLRSNNTIVDSETIQRLWSSIRVNYLSQDALVKLPSIDCLNVTPTARNNSEKWSLDPNRKHRKLVLSNHNMTINSIEMGNASVLGTRGFNQGVHEWQVTVQGSESCWIGIGVCTKDNLTDLIRDYTHYWGCSSMCERYKTTGTLGNFDLGDVINVKLDCDQGILTITGPNAELVANDLNGLTLFPIFNLFSPTNQITISIID